MILTRVLFRGLLLSSFEKLDGGVPSHAELLGEVRLLRGVHLSQADLGTLFFQLAGRLRVLGSQGVAVAAPGRVCGGVGRENQSSSATAGREMVAPFTRAVILQHVTLSLDGHVRLNRAVASARCVDKASLCRHSQYQERRWTCEKSTST